MNAHTKRHDDTPAAGRYVWIDVIRGLCLVLMTLDHIPDNPFQHLSYEPLGFFTAAHAFVFLSGFVNGRQLARVYSEAGPQAVRRLSWLKARKVYFWHAVTVIMTVALVRGFPDRDWQQVFSLYFTNSIPAAAGSLLLIYLPGLFFILPAYAVFFALTPFVVRQIVTGRSLHIMVAMWGLWGLAQTNFLTPSEDPARFYMGYFNLLAWQAVFFTGLLCGARTRSAKPIQIPGWAVRTACVVAAPMMVLRHVRPLLQWEFLRNGGAVNPRTAGWLGLLSFAAIAILVSAVPADVRLRAADSAIGRALCLLGQNMLPVYIWHVVLWTCLVRYNERLIGMALGKQTIMAVAAVSTLFVPALFNARQKMAVPQPHSPSPPAEAIETVFEHR